MGASRRTCMAVIAAALLFACARAVASVQVDPIARLSLEGGHDSNVQYDGRGSNMGRVSPDLGLLARDHTWNLSASTGGDLLMYPQNGTTTAWNQRGKLLLHSRPAERWSVDTSLDATYASDPIGLARLGIFATSAGFLGNGKMAVGWNLDRAWKISGLFEEHYVRFEEGGGTGAMAHIPGVEAVRKLGPRLEVGGSYRFDFFQGIGAGVLDARAQELLAVLRYRVARHLLLEVQGGPALWTPVAGASTLLPELALQLLTEWRGGGGARVAFRHGVGLGLVATPGLFDTLEAGVTTGLGKYFELHADGGFWRSGPIPWGGANAAIMYGIEGSFDYRVGGGVLLGVGGSRFARLDVSGPQYQRDILGLHVTWELAHRRGGP